MGRKRIHRHLVGAYVYELTVDGVVRYVGKGRRYRVVDHFSRMKAVLSGTPHQGIRSNIEAYTKFAEAMLAGAEIDYRIVANNLTDDEAFLLEAIQGELYPQEQLWNVAQPGRTDADGRRARRMWANPTIRASLIAKISAGHLLDKYRDQARLNAQAQWANPQFREMWMAQHRALWDDPAASAERCALLKAAWATNEEGKEKVRVAVTAAWTPERRAAMSENRRQAWADPEFKARVVAKTAATKATPAFKEKASAAVKLGWRKRKAKLDDKSGQGSIL